MILKVMLTLKWVKEDGRVGKYYCIVCWSIHFFERQVMNSVPIAIDLRKQGFNNPIIKSAYPLHYLLHATSFQITWGSLDMIMSTLSLKAGELHPHIHVFPKILLFGMYFSNPLFTYSLLSWGENFTRIPKVNDTTYSSIIWGSFVKRSMSLLT